MKKLFTLLTALLCFVVTAFAQNAISWNVGSGANDQANITWIGLAVPSVDGVTSVALKNIHLCTNKNSSGEKTAYMVISSSKNISDKVAVSTNNPTPLHKEFIVYNFENVTLTAGTTYYMFFSESNTNISSCGQHTTSHTARMCQ